MKFAEFKNTKDCPEPLYIVSRQDPFHSEKVFVEAESCVEEGARSFDWSTYDLEQDSEIDMVSEAQTLPWMSKHRWIYVKNAHLANGELLRYLSSPAPRTVVVLEIGKKVTKWPKLPSIEPSRGESPVAWIRKRAEEEGFTISQSDARALVDMTGEDRKRLTLSLEKLLLRHMDDKHIVGDSLTALNQQSKEYDVFSLIGALSRGSAAKALSILNRLFEQGLSAPQILSMLYWNFRRLLVAREQLEKGRPFGVLLKELKIWSYRGRERELRAVPAERIAVIVRKIRQADHLSKSSRVEERVILEELVVDACQS
jgi:DNA polymerase III delta subunit